MHTKHTKLARPHSGIFSRNEWAFLGAPCSVIQALAKDIFGVLAPALKIGYADAAHKNAGETEALAFHQIFTDKIDFQRFEKNGKPDLWQLRADFNDVDLVFVNGNHFHASRQIVLLDPRKFESLSRKLDRLTSVDALIFPEIISADAVPDFLKKHLPEWASLPAFRLDETGAIAEFFKNKITAPPLLGLVLAGGRSTRMGRDKGLMDWHGQPQRAFLAELLESVGVPAHFSCRAEQMSEFAENQRVIADTFLELGPLGAILSAFRQRPDAAWLVLACDLPLLDAATLRYLLEHRQTSALATAFRSPGSEEGFPEPLIAIWEPRAYPRLLNFLSQGISCPRKVLINSEVHLLDAPEPSALTNVNTPEEEARIKALFAPSMP